MVLRNNNGVYRNDAFLSTSLSKNLVEYGEYVNYIRIPKGEKILYIECVTATGMEYEVLLHPGAKFRMIDEINPKFVKWSM
ncbi:MAG: ADP-ribosyltransferase [Methanobrevibacter ruminantium]|uniref:ADP-ribosyltransferase n=1 Tax=Methanobrevibacter ruminantium TaxID=83816 RepID=UPI0026EA0A7A|nr:ADP-ribosyltransferase [Methanobrevibacter ruminantium]MDD6049649.1 ADP-ribosyltransferase [Methanobrevibacter ruminantium]